MLNSSIKLNRNIFLTNNFKLGELTVRSGEQGAFITDLTTEHFINLVRLADRLQRLRDIYGAPILVNSGYRTAEHNRQIGGAVSSRHITGEAADIRGADLDKLYELAEQRGMFGGIGDGRNRGFIHVDIRPNRSRWSY